MYVIEWMYRNTGIATVDNTIGRLMLHDINIAVEFYQRNSNDARRECMRVHHYYDGSNTDITDTIAHMARNRTNR